MKRYRKGKALFKVSIAAKYPNVEVSTSHGSTDFGVA